jgi:diacyltrehalose acyltransferase
MNPVTKGLGVFAALLPLVAVPTAAGAAQTVLAGQPLPDPPATVLLVDPINGLVQDLSGLPPPHPEFLCETRTCVDIIYPFFSIPDGVSLLGDAINSTSGPIIVFAYSQGGQVAEQWLKQHLNDPPKDLTFVLLGNSTRAFGGSLVEPVWGAGSPLAEVWPQSQYKVIDVAREYEFSADFPNNPFSLFYSLAIANAVAGGWYLHDYTAVDSASAINDPANTFWQVGNTTYVLIPTENLPLLDPLRQFGLTALADALNGPLKALVDQAYNRNYPGLIQPAPAAITPAADSTLFASVDSAPNVIPKESANTVMITTDPALQASPPNVQQDGLAVTGTASTPDSTATDVLTTVKEDVLAGADASGWDTAVEANPGAGGPPSTAPTVPLVNVTRDSMKAEPGQSGPKHRKPGGGLAGAVKSVQDTINSAISNISDELRGGVAKTGESSTGEAGDGTE